MSAPTSPDDAAVGPAERLHPLFLLTGLFGSVRAVTGAWALLGYLVISGQLTTAVIAAVAVFALSLIGVFLYWTRFEFRVGLNEVRIDSGIFSRTRRSIPFERIQDVDIVQGPLARVLGLAKVKFETGASGGAQDEEGALQAISLERAEEIRTLIRSRRGAPSAVETQVAADEDSEPVFAMALPRLLLSGVFNFSLALFAALIGATQTFGDALGFDPLSRGFWEKALKTSEPIAAAALQHRYLAAAAGAVLLILIGVATGVIRTLLRDYGFRLDRTEVGLRRRRGLLTRTDVTLPARRAQAAIIGTGAVRDQFGWSELKLQSLAHDEGSADHVLAPLATRDEIETILAELEWRGVPDDAPWQRISHAYIWSFVVALSPFLLLAGLQALVLGLTPLLADPSIDDTVLSQLAPLLIPTILVLIALGVAILLRVLAWGRTRYVLDNDRLLVRSGWWRRRTVILPLNRIQSIDISESLVSRWFGIATLIFGVAGGGMGGHRLVALRRETARELRGQLLV